MTWSDYDQLTPGEVDHLWSMLTKDDTSTTQQAQPYTRADGLTVTPH